MSSSPDHTPSVGLLALPPELRNVIYYLALSTTKTTAELARVPFYTPISFRHEVVIDLAHAKPPTLLLACHQIRTEALPIYFANNVFRIRTRPPTDDDDPILGRWGPAQRRVFRDALTITLSLPQWVEHLGLNNVHVRSFDFAFPDERGYLTHIRLLGEERVRWRRTPYNLATGQFGPFPGTWTEQRWTQVFKMYVQAVAKGCGDRGVSLADVQEMVRFARVM
ncbi:hypothetical protein LTR36_008598 [Oleoguttula mirabilis]|uniref:F-box domain-containing protein n=1 Tax=Oleoguttula mirabilis TaxID=1507867 RepID=A0AAV9JTF6_9PEZI|nr:hypothetical protein LTR36_008598 [Oleoguttula mirabilis]